MCRACADRNPRVGGLTLVEVLVAAALLLIVLGLIFSILVPTARAHARGTIRAELQGQAALALDRLAADLEKSAPAAVSLRVAGASERCPVVLGVIRVKDVLPEGQRVWEEKAIFYLWDETRATLVRKEWPPAPPTLAVTLLATRPYRFSGPDLAGVADSVGQGSERTLARDVTRFEVSHGAGTGPDVTQPLRLVIHLERQGAHQSEPERFDLRRTLFLEN